VHLVLHTGTAVRMVLGLADAKAGVGSVESVEDVSRRQRRPGARPSYRLRRSDGPHEESCRGVESAGGGCVYTGIADGVRSVCCRRWVFFSRVGTR
jgi:hypothetical protein